MQACLLGVQTLPSHSFPLTAAQYLKLKEDKDCYTQVVYLPNDEKGAWTLFYNPMRTTKVNATKRGAVNLQVVRLI